MSLPKCQVLSSRKFTAKVGYNINEPKQTQNVTVNVNPEQNLDSPCEVKVKYGDPVSLDSVNPYKNLKTDNLTEIELRNILISKDKRISALEIILNIIKNNPLIYKGCIITNIDDLRSLILLLADAEDVEISIKDIDISCCSQVNMAIIDKIFIQKGDEIFNMKYSCPDVIRTLDEHKISYKIVV